MNQAVNVKRIAMWSGPRNISTALMRAWENRTDTLVVDEPFYAYYLAQTGKTHPARAAVLAAQPQDWRAVVEGLVAPLPTGISVQYQKHMTHHIDSDVMLDWLNALDNCFLIRKPRNMLASLLRVLPDAGLADTGLAQQRRLFQRVSDVQGRVPPVIDSDDVLRNPRVTLGALCEAVGVAFSDSMLEWPAGPRDSDGVWAPFWYAAVEKSTGFSPWRPARPDIPDDKLDVLAACEEHYAAMAAHRIGAS